MGTRILLADDHAMVRQGLKLLLQREGFDVVFGKVNTEEQQELAGHFQIRSIPNVMLFREQVVLFAQPGAMPAAGIDSVIEQAKALDMDKIRAEIAAAEAAQSGGEAKP